MRLLVKTRAGTVLWLVQSVLTLMGLAALAGFAWLKYEEHIGQAVLERRFEHAIAEHRSVTPAPPTLQKPDRGHNDVQTNSSLSAESEPPFPHHERTDETAIVGRLKCERIGLEVIVVEGTDRATLQRAAGMVPGGARPGEQGNVTIAAHRDSYFRALRHIRQGDELTLETPQRNAFVFRVKWIAVVDPSDVRVMEPTPGSALTLVTCFPFDYIGPAPRRFIVRAANSVR